MDDLSPLFHDIEFKERFRGYDVEEVDAYIDRVAKAAALVQGRIAELQNRVSAAEAQPRTVVAEATVPEAPLDHESLTKMLLLAQRTADAAIEEAQAEAAEIRRQADEHASLVLAEAETDRRRLQAEAEASVEETVRTERERVVAEVAELERYRAFLADDIAILESHLASSRSALQASVAELQTLVEAPEQFRTPAMPATSGVQVPAELVAEPAPEQSDVEPVEAVPVFEPWSEADDVPATVTEPEPAFAAEVEPAFDPEPVPLEPVMPLEPVIDPEPVDELDPIIDAEPEHAQTEASFEPRTTTDADPSLDPEPTLGTDVDVDTAPLDPDGPWTDDTATTDTLTFDPGPMPDAPPARLPAADEATPVVDLTDEPIVLDGPPTAPTPIVDTGFVVEEPVTGEWSDGDTGTHTAVAPPLLVTAADLDAAQPTDGDWIDDLRVEAGPATEPVATVDDRLLFDDPEPSSSSEAFLEQLRDAVSDEGGEAFGEDALAAFFDDGDDDGGGNWFNRRR